VPLFGGDKSPKPGAAVPAPPATPAAAAAPSAAAAAVRDHSHDSLTGLLTDGALEAECIKAIEAANGGEHVACVYVAFDELRERTNHLGAFVTDQVVRELARRVRDTIRECDEAGHVNRDEFLIVFRQLRSRLEALALVSRLRISLAEPIKAGKGVYRPVVNVGLVHPPADGTTPETLLAAGEKAMLAMREQARETAKREAEGRVADARAAVETAIGNIAAAEQAVRAADIHLADTKRLLVEAKAAVVTAIEEARSLGIAVVDVATPISR
jgi:diguanylate cyclase (GGDEF)-like protein